MFKKAALFIFGLTIFVISADGRPINLVKNMKIEGTLEVEAIQLENYDGSVTSDLYLNKFEPTVEIGITKEIHGDITFLYEERGSGAFEVDEGYLTYGGNELMPFFISAGKKIVPFGELATFMATDSLTLGFAETRESVFEIGWINDMFDFSIYTFKGTKHKENKHPRVREFGGNFDFMLNQGDFGLNTGVSYLTSLADTDSFQDKISGANLKKNVPAAEFHLGLDYLFIHLYGEYIWATKAFQVSDFSFKDKGAKPSIMNTEMALDFNLFAHSFVFSLGYESSKEAVGLELPKERLRSALRFFLHEKSSVTFEWNRDSDYKSTECSAGDCGTGKEKDLYVINWHTDF